MDCAFCAEFTTPGANRIILEEESWVLLPTIGCFVPGYCLFMPLDHVEATADLSPSSLRQVASAVERRRTLVESRFGPTVVAEHGARNCDLGAACCTHCHLHLIPIPEPDAVVEAYRRIGGDGRRVDGLCAMPGAATGPYLYLSPRPGEHLLWAADDRFPRQFVRRVTARLHGLADRYDWRDHPFPRTQQETLRLLRAETGPAAGAR
ncbi:HIT domain-containing protein [Actinoplanes sp. NBRC 101535]|uniref:HIT domain-containing protein n=1 Tax=Actinoplanes sp. NBRC 101535 TaxID=3032196 RepID=UPI0024A2FAFB|nr:HIT domain-containing protein [Actinoplanes sp. NBRC 101535]GLY02156.1 hypothetical protein Acsp01_25350 [Actinoplanes sp. NBRC 101535]